MSDKSKPQDAPQATTPPFTVVVQQEDRNAMAAAAMADGKAMEMDTTVAGGRYKVGDTWRDANGKELKAGGDAF